MNTEARKRASAKFRAGQKAAGYKQKAFMLSPTAQAALAVLGKAHGSETKVLEVLLAGAPKAVVWGAGDVGKQVVAPSKPKAAPIPVRTLSPGRPNPKPGKR